MQNKMHPTQTCLPVGEKDIVLTREKEGKRQLEECHLPWGCGFADDEKVVLKSWVEKWPGAVETRFEPQTHPLLRPRNSSNCLTPFIK